ncbi:hypothetical protein [Arthrobacter sp. PAMC25564]|uniref:hypothetical protein n=1 Tax=Arthrobacter sp. PAMC25564 TaxID=2565366 RepID=UPI00197C4F6E|nr:hypothetical protein [Arthrobacter sp. PAMC25564]
MGKFRGWHVVAGIAAMALTYVLGTALGLNNTATFMSSCVAFVAVSLWIDRRISLRRSKAARGAARQPGPDGHDTGLALDADASKREG